MIVPLLTLYFNIDQLSCIWNSESKGMVWEMQQQEGTKPVPLMHTQPHVHKRASTHKQQNIQETCSAQLWFPIHLTPKIGEKLIKSNKNWNKFTSTDICKSSNIQPSYVSRAYFLIRKSQLYHWRLNGTHKISLNWLQHYKLTCGEW